MLPHELIMYHFIWRRSIQCKHWNQLLLLLPIFPNILISSIIMSKKYISNYTVCNLNNDCICQQPQVTKVFIVDMRYAIRCWPILLKFLGLFPKPWCNSQIFSVYEYLTISLLNCRKLLLKLPFNGFYRIPKRFKHLSNYCIILWWCKKKKHQTCIYQFGYLIIP